MVGEAGESGAGGGRDAEFRAYVVARSHLLLRTAYLVTGDHQLAEDLLQTALTKTYLAWGRIRDRESIDAYVRRVMVTTHVSWWRRKWRAETPIGEVPDGLAAAAAGIDESADAVERLAMWALLRGLPPRQRAVVVLRYYEDLSETEIAQTLGCTPGTVKSQAHRALASLRNALQAADAPVVEPSGGER
ncbi:MAG TPA: SigE family RNA polymerase sigma factor [Actinomycetes bacterium]|nr:SigE family RNA polymerase sigma factor [Actinomycetes bacterium]